MSTLLQGVLLYGEGDPVDVRLADGRIAEIGPGLPRGDSAPHPAAGLVLLPGLVDLHTHLREPGREDAETVETGTCAAARGGFTAVHAMANTDPVADNAGVVEQVWRLGREAGHCDVAAAATVALGLLADGPEAAQGTSAVDLYDFLDGPDDYDWLVPGLLERATGCSSPAARAAARA